MCGNSLLKVIMLGGKVGSGKDTYAEALKTFISAHSRPGDCHVKTLAFADPLRELASRLTDIPMHYFQYREYKDTPFTWEQRIAAFNEVNTKMGAFIKALASMVPIKSTVFDNTIHFMVPIRLELMIANLDPETGNSSIVPRDILKYLGAYGGILPTWTWYAAMLSTLDLINKRPTPHIVIISDMRTYEETTSVKSYCRHHGIDCRSIYINHWDKNANSSNHITETDLDNSKHLFTAIINPKEGREGMGEALSQIVHYSGLSILPTDTPDFAFIMEIAVNYVQENL